MFSREYNLLQLLIKVKASIVFLELSLLSNINMALTKICRRKLSSRYGTYLVAEVLGGGGRRRSGDLVP